MEKKKMKSEDEELEEAGLYALGEQLKKKKKKKKKTEKCENKEAECIPIQTQGDVMENKESNMKKKKKKKKNMESDDTCQPNTKQLCTLVYDEQSERWVVARRVSISTEAHNVIEQNSIPKKKKKRKSIVEDSSCQYNPEDSLIEENFVPKKKKKKKSIVEDTSCQDTPEDNLIEENSVPKKKKKRKSIVEDSSCQYNPEDNVIEENSVPKKKKKRKSIVEDISCQDTPEDSLIEENYVPKKKKKRKTIVGDASCQDTPEDSLIEENIVPKKKKKKKIIVEDTSCQDATHNLIDSIPKKKKKKKKSSTAVVDASSEDTVCGDDPISSIKDEVKELLYATSTPKFSSISNHYGSPNQFNINQCTTVEIVTISEDILKESFPQQCHDIQRRDYTARDSNGNIPYAKTYVDSKSTFVHSDTTAMAMSSIPDAAVDCHDVSLFRKAYANHKFNVDGFVVKDKLLLRWHTTQSQLTAAGVNFAKGSWTKKELDILNCNIEKYKKTYNVTDFKEYYLKNKSNRNCKLFEELGENILRVIRNIREKLDLMFKARDENIDPDKKGTPFTHAEIKELFRLQKIHGNNWTVISNVMGRSAARLSMKYSVLRSRVASGDQDKFDTATLVGNPKAYFTAEEDEKIRETIRKIGKYENGQLNEKEINWKVVESAVGTRSAKACCQRWSNRLSKTPVNIVQQLGYSRATLCGQIAQLLDTACITDIKEVDWAEVARSIDVDISPRALKQKFWCFIEYKYGNIPFTQALCKLKDSYFPLL